MAFWFLPYLVRVRDLGREVARAGERLYQDLSCVCNAEKICQKEWFDTHKTYSEDHRTMRVTFIIMHLNVNYLTAVVINLIRIFVFLIFIGLFFRRMRSQKQR